jgi:methionyl aminopeptidase
MWGNPHFFPFVANKASINDGIIIDAGMTLAIEPMAVLGGSTKTWVGTDNWSVYTEKTSSHSEKTVFVHEDGHVEIITEREKHEN